MLPDAAYENGRPQQDCPTFHLAYEDCSLAKSCCEATTALCHPFVSPSALQIWHILLYIGQLRPPTAEAYCSLSGSLPLRMHTLLRMVLTVIILREKWLPQGGEQVRTNS